MIPFQPHRSSSLLLRLDRNSSCLLWCDRLTAAAWQRTLKIDTVEDVSGCINFLAAFNTKNTRINIYVTNYTWKWIILILGSNIVTWEFYPYFFRNVTYFFHCVGVFTLRKKSNNSSEFPTPTRHIIFQISISPLPNPLTSARKLSVPFCPSTSCPRPLTIRSPSSSPSYVLSECSISLPRWMFFGMM